MNICIQGSEQRFTTTTGRYLNDLLVGFKAYEDWSKGTVRFDLLVSQFAVAGMAAAVLGVRRATLYIRSEAAARRQAQTREQGIDSPMTNIMDFTQVVDRELYQAMDGDLFNSDLAARGMARVHQLCVADAFVFFTGGRGTFAMLADAIRMNIKLGEAQKQTKPIAIVCPSVSYAEAINNNLLDDDEDPDKPNWIRSFAPEEVGRIADWIADFVATEHASPIDTPDLT